MKIFNLDTEYTVVCDTQDTRSGFKHVATLCRNGYEVCKTKICYYNRTWERFTYESVLQHLITSKFTGVEKQYYLNIVDMEAKK
jgi:hypothetical protein